jgi:hypothetical protein
MDRYHSPVTRFPWQPDSTTTRNAAIRNPHEPAPKLPFLADGACIDSSHGQAYCAWEIDGCTTIMINQSHAISSIWALSRRKWRGAIIALTLFAITPTLNAQQPTAADATASRELAIARPELIRFNGLIQNEVERVLSGSGEPSPEIVQLLRDDVKHPSLGDSSVPLHLRLIERQRRTLVATVNWAKSVGHCGSPDFTPANLADPLFRKTMQTVIVCRRGDLDQLEIGLREYNKTNETSVLELKLPPWTQTNMLAEARTHSANQNAALAPILRNRRATLQATSDLFNFVDAHSAEVRLINNQLMFGNDADAKTAQELMNKLMASAAAAE